MQFQCFFFSGNASLALEPKIRTVNELLCNRLEYNILIYSSYADAKYGGFEEDVVNSVKVGTFSGLSHVAALSNAVGCNIQCVYPEISNALMKRKHLGKVIRPRIANNKTISMLWLHTSNRNLKNWYPNHFILLTDTRPVLGISENKSSRF